MAAPLIGLGVGFLLGLRFKVFVLGPVTLAAVMLWAGDGLKWSNVGWMLLTAVAVQAGYLLGVVPRKEPEDEITNTRDRIRARRHGDAAAVRASKAGGHHRLLRE